MCVPVFKQMAFCVFTLFWSPPFPVVGSGSTWAKAYVVGFACIQQWWDKPVSASHPFLVQWAIARDVNLQLLEAKQTGRWNKVCKRSWTLSSHIQVGQWSIDLDLAIDFWGLNRLHWDILKYMRHAQWASRFDTGPVGDTYPLRVTVWTGETPEEIPNSTKQLHVS